MNMYLLYYFKLCLPFKLSRPEAEFFYFKYGDKEEKYKRMQIWKEEVDLDCFF